MAADLETGLAVDLVGQIRPAVVAAPAVQSHPVAALGCTVVVNNRPVAVAAIDFRC